MAKIYCLAAVIVHESVYLYSQGRRGAFVILKLESHFAQFAETVEFGNFDMKREVNDMGFVCEAHLQFLEKAVPNLVSNICLGKSKSDLLGQIGCHNSHLKNQVLVWLWWIRRLRANPAKFPGVLIDIHFSAFHDTLRRVLGVACMPGLGS
ncbi:MAG: hypothetical protein PHY54_13835 [Methylococcales bacterium]|nr:hypothetical protein [Methylococcales bacterium]